MSPASQGNLEVERYIGSCLISARLNNNSSKNNNVSNNHHGNYKNKKVANGDGGIIPRGGGGGGGRLQTRPLLGCPHHGPHMVPACECARYGSPGRHTPGGWAGMPLISMAVNARRNRKPPPPPPPPTHGPPRNMKPSSAPGGAGEGDAFLRTPLSRLAIHTQGAPLILAGHYGGRKNNNAAHRGPGGRQVKADLPGRKYNGGDVSGARDARNTGSNNTPSSDCLSVASDESSGHSENSLPRIIKPRKRRKKDRKPPASPPSETNNTESDPVTESSTIVTLKPYVPLCHDLYDGHRGGTHRREDVEARRKTWEKQRLTPEDDERVSQSSEEDAQNVKLQHDVDDVDDGDALLNTLFPYRCPPSICQCRYCDPSGLIWDVDQHCYSPFLTPPSLDLSYSTSPFVNIPLFLPPPPEVRSLDLFNKDFEDSSSPLVDTDHKEPVRRSWSEPSASFSARDDARASSSSSASSIDFGVIGGGRTCDDVSRNGRKDTRHSSTSSDSSLSQSLEVSTEIVTSLNGHRDIEIKFYSSSPPSAVAEAIYYRSGCESDDNVSQHDLWSGSTEHHPVCLEDMNHARFTSVWGNACEPEDPNVSDTTWSSAWEVPREQVTDSSNESNSKQLSDEVNQLCLHNVEE